MPAVPSSSAPRGSSASSSSISLRPRRMRSCIRSDRCGRWSNCVSGLRRRSPPLDASTRSPPPGREARLPMNIHEYQAKALLKAYGAPVADGRVAASPQEAADHARALGGDVFVVKAQIHAGGRGKGGGIKLVKTLSELHAE